MKVQAITCPDCGDTVFSRHRHDWRSCGCYNSKMQRGVFIDGGREYTRLGGARIPKPFELEIPMTEGEMIHDWNYKFDRYGLLKPGEKPEHDFRVLVSYYVRNLMPVSGETCLATKFEVAKSTVARWVKGVSKPHPRIRALIVNHINEVRFDE